MLNRSRLQERGESAPAAMQPSIVVSWPILLGPFVGRWSQGPASPPKDHETPPCPLAPPKIARQAGIALGRLRGVLTVVEIRDTSRHLREAR
jgi:hypothetical protein